jgi:AcrR family transcriptional regulator
VSKAEPRRSQQDRAGSTRAALISTSRALFAERGYAGVPADEIVTTAGLTRGALYHHYAGKQELFLAVFEELEAEVAAEVATSGIDAADLLTSMFHSLSRYLDICERPEVIRIALTDAPAVLGWQTWREVESRHGLGLIVATLQAAADDGLLIPTSAPIPVLAQLVLGALIEAALLIAHAPDRVAARAGAERGLQALLVGLVRAG